MNYVRLLTSKLSSFIHFGQECNNLNNKPAGLDGRHKTIFNTHDPRAYIYHHKDLNTWECEQMGSRDLSAAIWQTGNNLVSRIMLVSLYWESRVKDIPQLEQVAQYCRQENIPILIGTDANCKTTLANCATTCTRGNKLEAVMAQYSMVMANQGDTWTYFTVKQNQETGELREVKSLIDFTIASTEIDQLVTGWHVRITGQSK